MSSIRQERANSEIIKALALIIREKLHDPRLQKEFISITSVNCSPDFKYCKVSVSILGTNKNSTIKLLNKCEGFIKRELIGMVKMPYAPELCFVIDEGYENSDRVNKLLETIEIPAEEQTEEDEDF